MAIRSSFKVCFCIINGTEAEPTVSRRGDQKAAPGVAVAAAGSSKGRARVRRGGVKGTPGLWKWRPFLLTPPALAFFSGNVRTPGMGMVEWLRARAWRPWVAQPSRADNCPVSLGRLPPSVSVSPPVKWERFLPQNWPQGLNELLMHA